MSNAQRARDHYRWAERYSRHGDTEKARAHMKRAMHYGKTLGFGTGSAGPEERRAVSDEPSATRTKSAGSTTRKTDIVFILGPLNALAVAKITESIEASTGDGNKVEVYMQAFTEFDPVFGATNLTPMNFNQYSSDNPTALVDIIKENETNEDVKFYIFPTQTTKNTDFWSNAAQGNFVAKLTGEAEAPKIDELIRTAIVTWLKKDEDVMSGGTFDLKDKSFDELQSYASKKESLSTVANKADYLIKEAVTTGKVATAVPAIFDPFCAVCAAHSSESEKGKFCEVPGSGCLVAKPVSVSKNNDLTAQEKALPANTGVDKCPFERPRFELSEGAEPKKNCFVVTWGGDPGNEEEKKKMKEAATKDGTAYIEELWASFSEGGSATTSKGKRSVNRILIVQDYYDYDNKMSVWYILYAFSAAIIELFSVTRPVAEKTVIHAMRENRPAFDFAGGLPAALTPGPLTVDAKSAWKVSETEPTYPVAGPVFTKANFNAGDVTLDKDDLKRKRTFKSVIVDAKPLTFERFKQALEMNADRKRESDEEAECIAHTWYMFIASMFEKEMVGNQSATWSVTNGGHTTRHGLNPAMHTVVEDWYKDSGIPVGMTLTKSSVAEHAPKRARTA